MSDVTEQYLATWNATGSERDRLLAEHWAADLVYVDPMAAVEGREAMSALIDAVHAQFPGFVFTRASEADAHHQQVRFTWGLGPAGQEPVVVGFDVLMLDDDGRIRDVRGFLDRVPA
ncbi:nuclear transport factor 2 family protein [Aeromicrobium massiliense]|uniref:nuclear transport factor 2 family protein n=1 Tax=Aeromicrobium massiliense TaxID=1464554 RepID=UPI00031E2A88|nr:nuclear transport factor 2 family protein [Aeromicrobium massiliense]